MRASGMNAELELILPAHTTRKNGAGEANDYSRVTDACMAAV